MRPGPAVAALHEAASRQSPGQIRDDPSYRRFVSMMPLGNRAEDFGVALGLLLADRDAEDQDAFARALEEAGEDFLTEFHARFYPNRAQLRAEDPARWASLLGPYPEVVEVLRRRAGDVRLAIATAKDRDSVTLLLAGYEIDDLVPPECLVDKEAGRSKQAHLRRLQERFDVPFTEIVFVDDKVGHLDDVADLGVAGVLAAWGYNGRRERRLARLRGHRVCTLDDFETTVFG
jgi:phosphoglycolate phosphatase-like HAD superfamily hydrolase